jgi:hypothetical protein
MFHADNFPDGTTDFRVRFSGPVLVDTLRPDSVVMSAITTEQATGWRIPRRVPIIGMDHSPTTGASLPPGTTDQMRLIVRKKWIHDEIEEDDESWLSGRDFSVEIEIRGDLILDCHGQAVDGNAIGATPTPSGNNTPGGTHLSTFRVTAKPVDASDAS